MKIKNTVIMMFLSALIIPAGNISQAAAKSRKPKDRHIALSITGKNQDNNKTNFFNFGIMSCYQYLNGVSINLLSDISKHKANGLQLSGFVNIAGYKSCGVQVAGLTNVTSGKAYGLRIGGLMNISGNSAAGLQLSGLGNISGKSQTGVSVSGLINLSSKNNSGLQLSGLSNITGKTQTGVAISGLMNVSGGDMKGVQVSSLLNISAKANKGVQLAALGNISVENKGLQFGVTANYAAENKGVQLGLANVSGGGTGGVQLGVLNICNDPDNTARQIGLVNIKPHTRTQLLISSGSIDRINIAVRFKNKLIYTQIGMGMMAGNITDKASLSATYRTGLSFPVIKNKLNINTDIGYSHIETMKNRGIPNRLYSIQPRVEVEYSISRKFGVFVSGGYAWTRTYKSNASFSKDPLLEVGIALF